jgi:RNA polymerase sigma-70 factor (ECF subfamily)
MGGGLDESLIQRASEGDQDALAALLGEVTPELRARVDSRIGKAYRGALDADDILQVTFVEAFMRINTFENRGGEAFMGWLSRIAENNLRDAIRALDAAKRPSPTKRVHAKRTNDESYATLVGVLGGTFTTPSRVAAAGEAHTAIDRAIAQLPPDYAQVIRDLDLAGKSVEEVASAMGRSKGAVHMLRARAHEALRDQMGNASQFFSFG